MYQGVIDKDDKRSTFPQKTQFPEKTSTFLDFKSQNISTFETHYFPNVKFWLISKLEGFFSCKFLTFGPEKISKRWKCLTFETWKLFFCHSEIYHLFLLESLRVLVQIYSLYSLKCCHTFLVLKLQMNFTSDFWKNKQANKQTNMSVV